MDLKTIMKGGLRIDCWNFSVLNELEKSNKLLEAEAKEGQNAAKDAFMAKPGGSLKQVQDYDNDSDPQDP